LQLKRANVLTFQRANVQTGASSETDNIGFISYIMGDAGHSIWDRSSS